MRRSERLHRSNQIRHRQFEDSEKGFEQMEQRIKTIVVRETHIIYCFVGNSQNKQIDMTSPVHMDIGDSVSTMAFVMPSNFNKDNLPKPNSNEVRLETAAK